MSNNKLILKKKVVAHALSIAFGVGVGFISVGISPMAMAQSNASGTMYGTVSANAADSVTLKNTATNASRTISIGSDGKFTATALAPGPYTVTAMKGNSVVGSASVDVLAGQGTEAVFSMGTTQTVRVSARRSRIDVTNASNGAVFTARELDRLPVARNLAGIVALAPNTTRTDVGYAGSSFAGGGASENAYYINGYPVTNNFNQLGSSELPFGSISQAQVMVGGYGAEFGRSIGGVVNIITKSGTNKWEAGAAAYWAPNAFRAKGKDTYFAKIGKTNTAATDGKILRRNSLIERNDSQIGAYVGGPIIEDKLFMFVSGEWTKNNVAGINGDSQRTSNAVDGWRENKGELNRYLAKFDWNINDDHRLELTMLGDTPKDNTSYSGYDYVKNVRDGKVNSKVYSELTEGSNGGNSQILRYIGNLSDSLTLTALAGKSKGELLKRFDGYQPGLMQVAADANNRAPGLNYESSQAIHESQLAPGSAMDQKSYRLDLEYRIGQHTVRGGMDKIEVSALNAGVSAAGGGTWVYGRSSDPTKATEVDGGEIPVLKGHGALADAGYYVGKQLFSTVSNAYSGQSALYIEDKYQATKNLLLTLGIRSESFYNANKENEKYIEMKNQVTPRFSAVWDVNGDASMKIFGSAGRYTVPMPAMMALRGANGALNATEYYSYTGTDSNGIPSGLTKLTNLISSNNEFGQVLDSKIISAKGLKPSFQDEMSLGFERAYSPTLNYGAKGTFRTLRSTIDDLCDRRPFANWAARNKVSVTDYVDGCQLFNPGESNTFLVDFQNGNAAMAKKTYHTVVLSAEDIGFPKAKRTYAALDFFVEHPYTNGWYGKVNYTWSRNHGNTEGQTRSDGDGAQGDIAMTATWDYKEQAIGAEGLLPNDRTHQIKAFGVYDLNSELSIGANLLISSGRPISCFGNHNLGTQPNYRNANHFCFGTNKNNNVLVPRGSLGRMSWDNKLDLNLVYKPAYFPGFSVKLDVFNVLNNQNVIKYNEVYNNRAAQQSIYYGSVNSYAAGRSGRITAQYNRKF